MTLVSGDPLDLEAAALTLEAGEDRHFFTTVCNFSVPAKGRNFLRLKCFYRQLQQRHQILKDVSPPAGGQCKFDADKQLACAPPGPQQVHAWYRPVYADAVEWVALPNMLDMSHYGDEGLMARKPDLTTGRCTQRSGGPCKGYRYKWTLRQGARTCPHTTMYRDLLTRHELLPAKTAVMAWQVKQVARMTDSQKQAAALRADAIRLGKAGVAQ